MSLPAFASIETRIAAATVAAFANVHLTSGGSPVVAVLDSNVERLGDYGQLADRRDKLTIIKANYPALGKGSTLTLDTGLYTVAELATFSRSTWVLDALESDDGIVAVWWTR